MPLNLPTDLLRSFVAIVDSGSLLRATEVVAVTQSALSLQMRRLEALLQASLFHRDGRKLELTTAGTEFLRLSREILALNDQAVGTICGGSMVGPARIGLVQDFAETLLSGVLARFTLLHPEALLHIKVAGSPELLDLLQSDRLDAVFCMGPEDDQAAARVVPMIWHGDPALLGTPTLPLAVLETPCRFRDAALRALEQSGRSFRIAMETPSLSALRAAVRSGLAITCRTALFRPGEQPLEGDGLPSLPKVAYVRHARAGIHSTVRRLAELIESAALLDDAVGV